MRCVSMFVSSSTASPSSGGAITIGASGGLGLYLRHAWLRRLHAGRGLAKGSGQTAGREWLLRAPRRLSGVDVVVVRPARVVVDVLEPPVGQHALLRVHHREARLTTPRTRLPRRRTHGSLPSRISADLLHDDRADELHKLFDRELLRGKSGRSGACADGCLSPRSWRRRLDLARRQPS